jgi:NAD dependent epimerase/dehydratase family enzyme
MGSKNKVKKPEAFISASGVGIYGAVSGRHLHRGSKAQMIFRFNMSKWEAVANQFQRDGIRTVKVRTGLVLGKTMVLEKN